MKRKLFVSLLLLFPFFSFCLLSQVSADDTLYCPICGNLMIQDHLTNFTSCLDGETDVVRYSCYNHPTPEYRDVTYYNPYDHNYVLQETIPATCTENGENMYECSVCTKQKYEPIPATGHRWNTSQEATCTKDGKKICQECDKEEVIEALGHNYKKTTIHKETCTEEGLYEYTCSRCKDTYEKKVDALGHKVSKYEEVEPTCTTDGYKSGICSRCKQEDKTIYPALGHKWSDWSIITEATCTQKGSKQRTCSVCNEIENQDIQMLEHTYPEEWTVIKDASIFKEGLKTKHCIDCDNVIEEVIPKSSPIPLIVGGVGSLTAIAAIIYFARKKVAKNIVKKVIENEIESELPDLGFKTRSVIAQLDEEDELYKLLKAKTFLEVSCITKEEIDSVVEDEPDLFITTITSKKQLNKLLTLKQDSFKEINIAIIATNNVNDKLLKQSVEEEKIIAYVYDNEKPNKKFIKCILPILKPDIKSDESIENVGSIADALGIPGVSQAINIYLSGKDIKEIVEAGDMGFVDKADIVGDIASILGFEKIETITGLIDDVDSIKTAIENKDHAYEVKEGISGIKDIVDNIKE